MNADILSNLVVTEVHSVSTLYSGEGSKGRKRDRPRWAIVIKYEGESEYIVGERRLVSDISHVAVLPKGCSYEFHCTRAGHFCIVEFESDSTYPEPVIVAIKRGDRLHKALRELEHKRALHQPTEHTESLSVVYSVITALVGATRGRYLPTEQQKRIEPALEYISTHYDQALTNDMLAALVGTSTVYFRKLFVSVVGTSPIVYARTLRIEKAKEMLRSDYGTLSEVARSLGYPTLYAFSRDFKRRTGVAPSVWVGE